MYSCEPRRSRVCNAYQPCSMWPLLGPARHIPLLAIAIDRRDQVSGCVPKGRWLVPVCTGVRRSSSYTVYVLV